MHNTEVHTVSNVTAYYPVILEILMQVTSTFNVASFANPSLSSASPAHIYYNRWNFYRSSKISVFLQHKELIQEFLQS